MSASGQHPPCSNCSERGLKCVDEFAEVKAVKLLRRGRRLQQVEAVYGQNSADENALHNVTPPRSCIPRLRPEFFSSPFFRRFHIQRPVLEPTEFCTRYYEFCKGNKEYLQAPGQVIALILVVWAASFGVNEYGVEELYDDSVDPRRRRDRVNEMVREILYLIDIHGILRKPSWDGIRALLLISPLTQEVQSPIERLAMYEATMSQVYTLCSLAPSSSVGSGQGDYVDALVRARIFWYAHVIDGITTGLRGGRLVLTEDDLTSFERTLPSLDDNSGASALYAISYRYATIPLRIASVCREIHAILTSPRARQSSTVDEARIHHAWETLDRCWKEFDGLRQVGTDGFVQTEDVERFIDGWQIFIFECHNVMREALKQRLVARPPPDNSFIPDTHPSARNRPSETVIRLHAKASAKCQDVVRQVVSTIRRNLGTQFFQFDAALVRDGCFYAAFMLAGESGNGEDVETCLHALREMRWTFAKNDDREQTVRMIYESRMTQSRSRSVSGTPIDDLLHLSSGHPYARRPLARPISVPPLSLSLCTVPSSMGSASAPSTACASTADWPTCTPPGSAGTGMYDGSVASHRGSPTSPHDGLSVDTLRSGLMGPTLLPGDSGPSARPGESSGLDQVFFFNYGAVADTAGASTLAQPSTSLPPPATDYSPTAYFDANSVVFSHSPIGQQGVCAGNIPSSGSPVRHFAETSFYR